MWEFGTHPLKSDNKTGPAIGICGEAETVTVAHENFPHQRQANPMTIGLGSKEGSKNLL